MNPHFILVIFRFEGAETNEVFSTAASNSLPNGAKAAKEPAKAVFFRK
jgi:hypothetical protein